MDQSVCRLTRIACAITILGVVVTTSEAQTLLAPARDAAPGLPAENGNPPLLPDALAIKLEGVGVSTPMVNGAPIPADTAIAKVSLVAVGAPTKNGTAASPVVLADRQALPVVIAVSVAKNGRTPPPEFVVPTKVPLGPTVTNGTRPGG